MEKHFKSVQSPGVHDRFKLQLEYAKLLADYRKLAAAPFCDAAFNEMLEIATRLEEISTHIESHIESPLPSTVTEQFSMLDAL